MTPITTTDTLHVLRFDQKEDVWESLTNYCQKNTVTSGYFSAIGACEKVVVSFYDLSKKMYIDTTIEEDMEILTITGNISQMEEKYIVHAHGSFGKRDFSVVGGHIKSIIVSATCEVILTHIPKTIYRTYDQHTGLNLLK